MNGAVLQQNINDKFKTLELCISAVQNHGTSLCAVPNNLISNEICEIAINNNCASFLSIPEEMRTYDLCVKVIKNCEKHLKEIKNTYMDIGEKCCLESDILDVCLYIVKIDGMLLRYVPDYFKTEEMCECSINQNGLALQYVPDTLKTIDLCFNAINKDINSFEFIPQVFKTEKLCIEELKLCGCEIKKQKNVIS